MNRRKHGSLSVGLGLLCALCLLENGANAGDLPSSLPSGYVAYPIRDIQLLAPGLNPALGQIELKNADELVTNGTFYDASFKPVGTVYAARKLRHNGVIKARKRGAIAILADGTIRLCLQPNSLDLASLQATCARGASPIDSFMGGGALILSQGKAVTSESLYTYQRFDNGGNGLDAEQFRKTTHTLVALKGSQAYIIGATSHTGRQMQADLIAAGFEHAVMFDGGSGFHFRSQSESLGSKPNPSGFLIRVER